jgi:hypothetical protein
MRVFDRNGYHWSYYKGQVDVRVSQTAEGIRTQRPILQWAAGCTLLAMALAGAYLALRTDVPSEDQFASTDAWMPLAFLGITGAAYTYVASSLEVTASHVVIRNPLRRIVIPLGHVTSVREGSNLCVETGYSHAYAWGVEAANVDLVRDHLDKQGSLQEMIMARAVAKREVDGSAPRARYCWAMPPAFVLAVAPVYVLTSAAIAFDWHPLG